jgi:hypothetical protein
MWVSGQAGWHSQGVRLTWSAGLGAGIPLLLFPETERPPCTGAKNLSMSIGPATPEAEAGGSLESRISRLAWATQQDLISQGGKTAEPSEQIFSPVGQGTF